MPRRICWILPVLGVLVASCTSTYHRDYQRAVADAKGVYENPTGPWVGEWTSVPTGHEGPLWCVITAKAGQPDTYDFRYRAGWGMINFGDYVHTAKVEKTADGALKLDSAMELPEAFGTYTVKGTVSRDAFDATHRSDKGDHGAMTLRRPR